MKLLKWLLYFICLFAPFMMLLPINFGYNWLLIIGAFLVSMLTILVVNKKKDDTHLVIMPASMVMKRALIHPEISLLCASSLFSSVAILHGHLGADYNIFSGSYFNEALSAFTSGKNAIVGILMFLPALSLVLFLFKFLLSAHTKSLKTRTVWYIILYIISLATLVLTFGFTKVVPADYFAALKIKNNMILVIAICAVCLLFDIIMTLSLWRRSCKFRKLAINRQERLHDIDDIDEYTRKQLLEEQAFEVHQKRVDKKQRKLNKKLFKQNKKLHKKAAKFEKYLEKHPELREKQEEQLEELPQEEQEVSEYEEKVLEEVLEEAKEEPQQEETLEEPKEEEQVEKPQQEEPQEEKPLTKKEKKRLELQRKIDEENARREAKLAEIAEKKALKEAEKQAKLAAKRAKKNK